MATKFQIKQTLPGTKAQVLKMYSDPAYLKDKYAKLGATDFETVSNTNDGRTMKAVSRYKIRSSADLPDWAKKMTPELSDVTETSVWDLAAAKGTIEFEIKGLPAKVKGDMALTESGAQTVNTLDWVISSGIPLLGGKVEKLVASDIQTKAPQDERITAEMVSRYA